MFPLHEKNLPPNAEAFRLALENSLHRILRPAGPMVTVEDRSYPSLAAIRIRLDRADLGQNPPRPPLPQSEPEPALEVGEFEISGRPLIVQDVEVDLACEAQGVRLGQARDEHGNLVLLLQAAKEGHVEMAVSRADLELLVLAGAKAQGAKHGVIVEDAEIELNSPSERALDIRVHVQARKLFLTAKVEIKGSALIDDKLGAHLNGLKCKGEGAIGSLACGFIEPHLQRLNGRKFSLLALPLGEVKLRDVRITTGAELRVRAEFGSEPT